jgi:hypothetical protein
METKKPEMVVCPKPEQMMICPKARECPPYRARKYNYCMHKIEHPLIGDDGKACRGCPACIPVPSTPASKLCQHYSGENRCKLGFFVDDITCNGGISKGALTKCLTYTPPASVPLPPDELLREEIAHWLSNFYYRLNNWECSIMPKTYYDSEKPLLLKREAEALLAKCRQSEAAIRADQNKKIGDAIDKTENPYKSKGVFGGEYHGTDYGVFEIARQSFKEVITKLQNGETLSK